MTLLIQHLTANDKLIKEYLSYPDALRGIENGSNTQLVDEGGGTVCQPISGCKVEVTRVDDEAIVRALMAMVRPASTPAPAAA